MHLVSKARGPVRLQKCAHHPRKERHKQSQKVRTHAITRALPMCSTGSPGVFTFAPINNLTCKYADDANDESFLHAPLAAAAATPVCMRIQRQAHLKWAQKCCFQTPDMGRNCRALSLSLIPGFVRAPGLFAILGPQNETLFRTHGTQIRIYLPAYVQGLKWGWDLNTRTQVGTVACTYI